MIPMIPMIPLASIFLAIGVATTVIGAAAGIGALWAIGLSSMARQPELQPKIQTTMIIGAAFIEGIALFALVICMMKG